MRIIAFYSFFKLINPNTIEKKINNFFSDINIKGSVLLSAEGVNGNIALPRKYEKKTKLFLLSLGIEEIKIKIYNFDGKKAFHQFKIKKKKEIVTSDFNLTINEINQGQFIDPQKWDTFIDQKDVIVLDARNNYEYRVGHFEKATNANIESFREFKKFIEINKETFKGKKIAIYCTGGIRCEKAGPLMQKYGIDTFQLKGGILKYFEVSKAEKWTGECFVFDYRVALDKNLKPGNTILCYGCNMPMNPEETKSKYYKEGFSCQRCYKSLNDKKTRSLADKKRHWKALLE